MDKKKVIHVVNLQSYGGIQKIVKQIVNSLDKNDNYVADVLSTKSIDILEIEFSKTVSQFVIIESNAFVRLRKTIRLFKGYDIIHFHGPYTFFQLAALFTKSKIVYTEHGTLQKANIKNTLKHVIQKRLFGKFYLNHFANAVLFVSKWLKEDLKLNKPKQYIIYNGLKRVEAKIANNDSFTLTIAARLIPKKRIDMAIDVMHKLSDEKDIKLQIIGDGPETETLKNRAGSLLNQSVIFLGYRPDAYDIIASSDIYLMTTFKEPFGLVVLEAMMSKTLVLAMNDCGGAVEILGKEFPNLICSDIDDIVGKIKHWKKELYQKQQVETGLLKLYNENFTIDKMIKNIEQVYNNLH